MEPQPQVSLDDFSSTVDLFSQIAERILGNENIHITTEEIFKTLRSLLQGLAAGLYLKDKDDNLYLFDYTKTPFFTKLNKYIPGDILHFRFPVKNTDSLLSKCFREDKIVSSNNLVDFFYPAVPKMPLGSAQFISGIRYLIGIPIRIKGKPSGVLFAGFKKTDLTHYEKTILQFFANLSGLALENNIKLQEIHKRYEMEKETTAILSHELKTPITIAHHSAQTILTILKNSKKNIAPSTFNELTKTADDIQHGMDRLTRICNSIFDLREVENKVPEDIHVIDLKKHLGQILFVYERKTQNKGLKFHTHLAENKKNYCGGIMQLEQIVSILLDNAIKYTKKGEIIITSQFKNKKLITTITDTGDGIPKNHREHIFRKYYRAIDKKKKTKKNEGLGLGLYIAEKIVRGIGGNIKIADNPKTKGSSFIVEIPVYDSK